ncbi:UNVERIFIED_CONTAM: hypothetical protein Slati_3697900 [Sesamum latifolium]|uniref:Reverse transcriptase zinc-binding domain-containing protein n=1 Tax=Sesamum latifolium TaxID=2727402 RepID=A0AAW2U3A6_9LAMI
MDAACILGIELPDRETRDEIVWHFERHGRFSVRSAYKVAREMHREAGGSEVHNSWRFPWRSKAMPKVILFAWKCARNALPTTSNLRQRGVQNRGCWFAHRRMRMCTSYGCVSSQGWFGRCLTYHGESNSKS